MCTRCALLEFRINLEMVSGKFHVWGELSNGECYRNSSTSPCLREYNGPRKQITLVRVPCTADSILPVCPLCLKLRKGHVKVTVNTSITSLKDMVIQNAIVTISRSFKYLHAPRQYFLSGNDGNKIHTIFYKQ